MERTRTQIALLDLNYTLVANSIELSRGGWKNRQEKERYRGWLIELIRQLEFERVIMITARQTWQQEWTLENIKKHHDWQPDQAIFNWTKKSPPMFKEQALHEIVFPEFGTDGEKYFSFESNMDTHKMYARYGIKGMKVFPHSEVDSVFKTEVEYEPASSNPGQSKLF